MSPEQLRNQILAADLAWIPVALAAEQVLCAELHCTHIPLRPANFVVYVVCTVFAWVLLSENMHLDCFRGGWRLSALVSHLLLACMLLIVLLLAVEYFSGRYVGRLTLSLFSLFLLIGFLGIRGIARQAVHRRHRNGQVSRVLILGSDRLASELAAKFDHHPELLCSVVGFLCPEAEALPATPGCQATPIAVSTVEVIGLLREHRVNEIVMAHSPASNEILNLVALCRRQAIQVSVVPQPYELYLSRPSLLDLGGLPLLRLGDVEAPAARIGKRIIDLALGSVLAAISLPAILVCGVFLWVSTGRAFRWEQRIGWRGVPFSMLRLNVDHDPDGASCFERILDQLSISELPQFWNVLRGEMSLVGPRPEGPERANHYSTWQQERLSVKPGMTGLAQVHGLREQHSSDDKTRHDLQYMLHLSLLRDVSLIVETIWTLTIRLITIKSTTQAVSVVPSRTHSVLYPPDIQPFPETLQHAHRTQPGSD